MQTIAQRIESLRTGKNLSRPALAAALGLPRTAIEKFETGRLTPTQAQLERLAEFFEITVSELKGGDAGDAQWMDGAYMDIPAAAPGTSHRRTAPAPQQHSAEGEEGTSVMDALLSGKKFQKAMTEAALEALRSPEGQELLSNVVRRELERNRN